MPRRMFKYRLYPSKTQTKVLEEQLELCRLAHNSLLDYCKQQYKEKGKTPAEVAGLDLGLEGDIDGFHSLNRVRKTRKYLRSLYLKP